MPPPSLPPFRDGRPHAQLTHVHAYAYIVLDGIFAVGGHRCVSSPKANESDAAQKALWAGVDMSMQSGLYRQYIPTLVEEGRISMATLDTAVRRVLQVKARAKIPLSNR